MPDFSTVVRDIGLVPTIIGCGILALLVYSIIGPKKSNGNSNGNAGKSKNSGTTQSTQNMNNQHSNTGAGQQSNLPPNGGAL